jgi:hypothetical protein
MTNFWNWLVKSSADETKLSLTLKGAVPTVIGFVLLASPLLHITTNSVQLNEIANIIIQAILGGATIISVIATFAGLYRKLTLTVTTTNKPQQPLPPSNDTPVIPLTPVVPIVDEQPTTPTV